MKKEDKMTPKNIVQAKNNPPHPTPITFLKAQPLLSSIHDKITNKLNIHLKVFPKAREGVTKVAVIIVDEQQDKDRRWWTSVVSLRRADVRVVLVGVGPGFSYASLRSLMRNDTGIVIMESFAGLMGNAVELAKTTCHVAG